MAQENAQKNEMLRWALWYAEHGFSVIPVGKDKKPLVASWKPYQLEAAKPEQIEQWWKDFPEANIAVITGEKWGIAVVDVDHQEEVEGLPATVMCSTGRGFHYYYRHPGRPVTTRANVRPGVDVRADGGYAVIPPSVHMNGNVYTWDQRGPLDLDALADLPAWVLEPSQATEFVLSEPNRVDDLVTGVTHEGGRNDAILRVMGQALHHLPVHTREGYYKVIEVFNQTHMSPPLPADELRRTFESCVKMEDKKRQGTEQKLESITEGPLSIKELCEKVFPDQKWAIEGLFETASINMISAPPNQYKSWIVMHMCICLVKGEPVFGHFKTEQQAVMIVNGEDTQRLLQERSMMLMMQTMEDLPIYFFAETEIGLTDEAAKKLLIEAQKRKVGFIVFDSLRSMHDAEENSSTEMQVIMNVLKHFTRAGITVLFTHHNRKKPQMPGRSSSDDSGEDTRGSSAINGAVHGHISCDPAKSNGGPQQIVIRQPKLKGAKKLDPFTISVEATDTSFGLSYVGAFAGNETKADVARQMILETLGGKARWLSLRDFLSLGIGETSLRKALAALSSDGLIHEKTKAELANIGFSLPDSSELKHNAKFYSIPMAVQEELTF